MPLKDRVVVITGATGGLGMVVTKTMAAQGARLALLSTNIEKLENLTKELAVPEDRVLTCAADLSDPDAVEKAARAVVDAFGKAEILLHLVGGWAGGSTIAEADTSETENMLRQHLWTTHHLARAFGPYLEKNSWGRIVVVSSPIASRPTAKMSAYAVGKAAQEALILTLAKEIGPSGVTANILSVRTIDVEHEKISAPSKKNASWTTPEEIAAAMVYLCSDEAQSVNGARLALYGSG